jgi:SAM-dependent methyltransferase
MHLNTMYTYRHDLAHRYVQKYILQEKIILDVGCGAGEFIECLKAHGADAAGIEPSEVLVKRGRERGHKITFDFLRPGAFAEEEKFNGFTCLQVLEHVDDPVGFLKMVRPYLENDAIGVVEVPALEKICDDRRLYEFFVDHINYFSERTLRVACELAGFRVLEVIRGFDEQFLVSFITPDCTSVDTVYYEMLQTLEAARVWVREQVSLGRKVVAWGAGYKSTAALAELNLPEILAVVDSDPAKAGLFCPVSHLPVEPPSYVRDAQIDAVLITAAGYKREIHEKLLVELGFSGSIAALGKGLEIL